MAYKADHVPPMGAIDPKEGPDVAHIEELEKGQSPNGTPVYGISEAHQKKVMCVHPP